MAIVLAGLLADKNLGDLVIFECTKYLLETECESLAGQSLITLDLQGLNVERTSKSIVNRKVAGARRRLSRWMANNRHDVELRELEDYYRRHVSGAHGVVIAGGGLIKFRYQKFWLYLSALVSTADELGVPVALNAVGVEGYDEADVRCETLKNNLNKSIVKRITTRDDIDCLGGSYLARNQSITSEKVADPAVWASTVYGVKRDETANQIGIGLIRGDIFTDNGIDFSKANLTKFYVHLINEMDRRNIPWRVFTNGLPKDSELAECILGQLDMPRALNEVLIPRSPRELVSVIANFKGIVAARLHANIIAYSLGISSVGLVWNDKLSEFGRTIHHPERFVRSDQFNAKYVIELVMSSVDEGNDRNLLEEQKASARSSVSSMLEAVGYRP